MELNNNSLKPIFIQVAEWVEDEILNGNIIEGDKIFSQVEFAKIFNINPLTAGKGMTMLETKGVVMKKRGLGMFVAENAKQIIHEYRKNESLLTLADDLIDESIKLNMNIESLFSFIRTRAETRQNKSNRGNHND